MLNKPAVHGKRCFGGYAHQNDVRNYMQLLISKNNKISNSFLGYYLYICALYIVLIKNIKINSTIDYLLQ